MAASVVSASNRMATLACLAALWAIVHMHYRFCTHVTDFWVSVRVGVSCRAVGNRGVVIASLPHSDLSRFGRCRSGWEYHELVKADTTTAEIRVAPPDIRGGSPR